MSSSKNSSDVIVVRKPNPYIYVLLQDGEHVCFSSTIKGIKKSIDSRFSLLGLSYVDRNLSMDEYDPNITSVNVYANYTNFLFQYFRVVSRFDIYKIPHYRFELAKSIRKSHIIDL